jgi:hypothetical protein
MLMILAHTGHWLVSLLYLVPVLGVLAMVGIQVWRDRRRQHDGSGGADERAD